MPAVLSRDTVFCPARPGVLPR